MKTARVEIGGMHCDGCVTSVHAALSELRGVDTCDVSLREATVTFDDSVCGLSDVLSAIRAAGAFEVTGFSSAGE